MYSTAMSGDLSIKENIENIKYWVYMYMYVVYNDKLLN